MDQKGRGHGLAFARLQGIWWSTYVCLCSWLCYGQAHYSGYAPIERITVTWAGCCSKVVSWMTMLGPEGMGKKIIARGQNAASFDETTGWLALARCGNNDLGPDPCMLSEEKDGDASRGTIQHCNEPPCSSKSRPISLSTISLRCNFLPHTSHLSTLMAYKVLSPPVLARTYAPKTQTLQNSSKSTASGLLQLLLDLITSSTPTQKHLGCPPFIICILFSFSYTSLTPWA